MKRILVSIVALFALCLTSLSAQAQGSLDGVDWREMNLDYSSLTADNHPRLFLTDADIKGIKKNLGKNPQLASLSKILFEIADGLVDNSEPLEYKFDKAGRSILKVSNEALRRIVALSYAYRMTRKSISTRSRSASNRCAPSRTGIPSISWIPRRWLSAWQ